MATEEERKQPWNLHSCRLCSYGSKSAFVMFKHVRIHKTRPKTDTFICDSRTPEKIECEFCDYNSDFKVKLKEHFRVFHEGKKSNNEMKSILKRFQCKNGDFETYSLLSLTRHEDDCNATRRGNLRRKNDGSASTEMCAIETNSFECPYCPYKSKQKPYLKTHIYRQHLVLKVFNCTQCSFKTRHKKSLKQHITGQHLNANVNWLRCVQCRYKTMQKTYLKLHTSQEHLNGVEKKWFKCTQCSYKTGRVINLRSHMAIRHFKAEDNNWFKCTECSFETKQNDKLKNHILALHLKPKETTEQLDSDEINWFKCEQCSFKATQKCTLETHVLTHLNPKDVNWCPECSHKLTPHKKRNWFNCAQCVFRTTLKLSMKSHILPKRLNFKDGNSIKCTQCAFKTKNKLALRMHILHEHFI